MALLMRRDPWHVLNQLHHNIDEVFKHNPSSVATNDINNEWVPTVDITEENDKYVLHADIPGVDPKNIDLTIEQGYLTLKGHREKRTSEDKAGYHKTECTYGSFVRRFKLPESVESDSVSAKGEHGVLEIVIPKTQKAEPRKIQVSH